MLVELRMAPNLAADERRSAKLLHFQERMK